MKTVPTPKANAAAGGQPTVVLRLYIAGSAPNSRRAVANLRALIDEHWSAHTCQLEVVDILANTERALRDQVLVTPTLVKVSPEPQVEVIGDLSQRATVLEALGL